MSSAAVFTSIYPAYLTAGPDFARVSFPAWLQKRAPMTRAARIVQEMHTRIKPWTSCSCREMVTSSYHDVLHRRLLKPLLHGAAQEGARALHACGLTREFFTEQAPVLRQTLNLEDGYKKVDAKVKQQLQQEIQALTEKSRVAKRTTRQADGPEGTGTGRKRGRGGEEQGDDAGEAAPGEAMEDDGSEEEGGMVKKRKLAPKGKKNAKAKADLSKTSLASWLPSKKPARDDAQEAGGEAADNQKAPLMLLRFIEGHTCAVRRRVHLKDFLAPWAAF